MQSTRVDGGHYLRVGESAAIQHGGVGVSDGASWRNLDGDQCVSLLTPNVRSLPVRSSTI